MPTSVRRRSLRTRISWAASARCSSRFDEQARRPGRVSNTLVKGQQRHIEELANRDVGGVIRGEVVPQLPHPRRDVAVRDGTESQQTKLGQGALGRTSVNTSV